MGLEAARVSSTREILQSLYKTVTSASVEDTRIAISTSDGCCYHFYGFLRRAGRLTSDSSRRGEERPKKSMRGEHSALHVPLRMAAPRGASQESSIVAHL